MEDCCDIRGLKPLGTLEMNSNLCGNNPPICVRLNVTPLLIFFFQQQISTVLFNYDIVQSSLENWKVLSDNFYFLVLPCCLSCSCLDCCLYAQFIRIKHTKCTSIFLFTSGIHWVPGSQTSVLHVLVISLLSAHLIQLIG